LQGRAVVSLDDATKIGEVEDLMVDPASRHIVSLKVRVGYFKAAHLVPATDVKSVGADAVTVTTNRLLADPPADSTDPGLDSQAAVELTRILGTQVVTDAGTLVGQLSDIVIDWSTLEITGYEVREGGLFAKAQLFTATPEVRFGVKITTMPAELLSQPA
jgi:sporulation protein YlmC with PRC-barrel domain